MWFGGTRTRTPWGPGRGGLCLLLLLVFGLVFLVEKSRPELWSSSDLILLTPGHYGPLTSPAAGVQVGTHTLELNLKLDGRCDHILIEKLC